MADPFQSDSIPNENGIAFPQTPEQFSQLPNGTPYQDPTDGIVKRKGGGTLLTPPVEWRPFRDGNNAYLVNTRTGATMPFGNPIPQHSKELDEAQTAFDAADRAWRAIQDNPAHQTQGESASRGLPFIHWGAHPAKPAGVDMSNKDVQNAKSKFDAAQAVLNEKKNEFQMPTSLLPTAMQTPSQQPLQMSEEELLHPSSPRLDVLNGSTRLMPDSFIKIGNTVLAQNGQWTDAGKAFNSDAGQPFNPRPDETAPVPNALLPTALRSAQSQLPQGSEASKTPTKIVVQNGYRYQLYSDGSADPIGATEQ